MKLENNKLINTLLTNNKIDEDEYKTLFENKKDYTKEQTESFNNILQKIIDLMNRSSEKTISLNHIIFPDFIFKKFNWDTKKNISFRFSTFASKAHFGNVDFINSIYFNGVVFEKSAYFKKSTFYNNVSFNYAHFMDVTFFNKTIFLKSVSFKKVIFDKTTYFSKSIFKKDCNFYKVLFKDELNMKEAEIHRIMNFWGTKIEHLADFSESTFYKIDLTNIKLNDINFLALSGFSDEKKTVLKKNNFENKESVRLIKTHFEKQNNIIEANKYFQIEQDFYIEDLTNSKTEPNKFSSLATLYLNKWVSNFGTDWIRSLLFLFTLSYLFMRLYIDLDSYLGTDEHIKHFTQVADIRYIWTMLVSWGLIYLSTFFKSNKFILWSLVSLGIVTGIIGLNNYDSVLDMQNYIIQLTNPINAFKNMNLYDGIEIYGAFVRIVVVTIIYQFIVAFRQNTRRK